MTTTSIRTFGFLATLGALAGVGALAGPSTARADEPATRVYAGAAMDPTVVTRLGVERDVATPAPHLVLAVPATLTLPVLRPGGGDGELRAGVRADWRPRAPFLLRASLLPYARTTDNDAYGATALGVDLELVPAVVGRRGLLGLELGSDHSLATHVRHTQAFRDRVYADAVDGWYQGASGALRAGLRGELHLGRFDLRLRTGLVATEAGGSELLPFYAELGLAMTL